MLIIKVMLFYQFTTLVLTSALPFEVFLSFRGSDTREGFTDYLYKELKRAGIHTFRDENGIQRGENIDLEIKKAIYESKLSIIVFSKYYATSTYCLDEVVKIMKQRRTVGHMVLPVFYRVRTSHVGEQTGTYADAFNEHQKDPKVTTDMVEAWRAALSEAASLGGIVYKDGYETQLIEKVVEEVKLKLNHRRVDIASTLVQIVSSALQLKYRCVLIVFNKFEDKRKPSAGPVSFDWWFIKLMGFILFDYLLVEFLHRVFKRFFQFFCRFAILFSRGISLFKQTLAVVFRVFKNFFKLIRPLLAPLSGVFRGPLICPHHSRAFLCYRDARASKKFGKALSNNLDASGIDTFSTTEWKSKEDNPRIQRELDQSKVENQNGSYACPFNKYKESQPEDTLNTWRKALREAAQLEPKILREDARDETQFIEDVVERIRQKLTGLKKLTSCVGKQKLEKKWFDRFSGGGNFYQVCHSDNQTKGQILDTMITKIKDSKFL